MHAYPLYTLYLAYIQPVYGIYGPAACIQGCIYRYRACIQGYSLYTVHRPYIGDLAYVQACICLCTAYRANIGYIGEIQGS